MSSIEVFCTYSHRDEELRDQLEKHLSLLKWEEHITTWHDRRIVAGQEWMAEIDAHLNNAHIILLLISPDFMASTYCYSTEVKQAIEKHERGEAYVIPVILRPVYWQGAPFGKLQALPKDAKPITSWQDKDEAFLHVVAGIRHVIEELKTKRSLLETKAGEETASIIPLLAVGGEGSLTQLSNNSGEASSVKDRPLYILVVDDDTFSNDLLRFVLGNEGFEVNTINDARKAYQMILKRKPDILLLDVTMPYIDGFEFAAKLRVKGLEIPLIFLTARDDIEAKLYGFNIGAEDYVCKPCNHQELLARMQVVARRNPNKSKKGNESIHVGQIELFPKKLQVVIGGKSTVTLTSTEVQVLQVLMERYGSLVIRDQLLEVIWDIWDIDDKNVTIVDIYIHRLRMKLEADASRPRYIISVEGVGYTFKGE